MGRPSLKSPELVESICERLAQGEPLAAICRDEGMPHPSTVRDWMKADEAVSLAIARAREDGEDWLAAECLEIADDGRRDYVPTDDGRGVVDHDHIQRSKLRIDTRLKLLAKWNPKKYGERLALAGDPEAPIGVEHSGSVTLEPGDAYLRMLNGG
jgi:hypothetical protein